MKTQNQIHAGYVGVSLQAFVDEMGTPFLNGSSHASIESQGGARVVGNGTLTHPLAVQLTPLQSAAPELLAVLQRWAEHYKQTSDPAIQGIACETFAAIAKATGQSL